MTSGTNVGQDLLFYLIPLYIIKIFLTVYRTIKSTEIYLKIILY